MPELKDMYRTTDPATSREAAISMIETAKSNEIIILEALRSAYPESFTAEELGRKTGLGHVPVNRRLASMERRNLVWRPGIRRNNETGRSAMVWQFFLKS